MRSYQANWFISAHVTRGNSFSVPLRSAGWNNEIEFYHPYWVKNPCLNLTVIPLTSLLHRPKKKFTNSHSYTLKMLYGLRVSKLKAKLKLSWEFNRRPMVMNNTQVIQCCISKCFIPNPYVSDQCDCLRELLAHQQMCFLSMSNVSCHC